MKLQNFINKYLKDPRILKYALTGCCLSFALSIALSQIFLALFAVLMIVELWRRADYRKENFKNNFSSFNNRHRATLSYFYYPAFVWMLFVLIALFFGLNFFHSFGEYLKFILYFSLPYLVFVYLNFETAERVDAKIHYFLLALFIGQGIAASHTVISTLIGVEMPIGIPGALTEAGQISLLFPVYLGVAFNSLSSVKRADAKKIVFLGLLIVFALLINLKRGPWFAVFVTSSLFFLATSYKRFLTVVVLAVSLCFLPPIYHRLLDFHEHFFIAGGRFDMWKLGFQLIERFPLGIGFSNSDMMRKFDPALPLLHRHMHNNFLNVTLENGIFVGVIFVWWFAKLILGGFRESLSGWTRQRLVTDRYRILILSFTLTTLSLQIAGVVEYNFGDGEIRYMYLLLIGLMFGVMAERKNSEVVSGG